VNISFFATTEDILVLFAQVFANHAPTVFEVYSDPSAPIKSFQSYTRVTEYFRSRPYPYLALWFPEVMPDPTIRSFTLNNGIRRFTVEGCGLFWLNPGSVKANALTVSHLMWFSEAGARAKCSVTPGSNAVFWPDHKRIATYFTNLLRRKLKAAAVPGRPVLLHALAAHRAGLRLVEHHAAPVQYTVEAT
jgi:hypothetical protein